MAWVPADQTIANHPTTKRLCRKLEISTPEAVGLVILTQHWAINYAPNGDLSKGEAADLADGVGWTRNADEFLDAMIFAGFIDPDKKLHNWDRYGGKYIRERDKGRERKTRSRQRNVPKSDENPSGVTRDSSVTDEGVRQESSGNPPIDMTLRDMKRSEERKCDLIPPHPTPSDADSADDWQGATGSARPMFEDEDEEDSFREAPLPTEPPEPDEWNGDLGWETETAYGCENDQAPSLAVSTQYANHEPDVVHRSDDDVPEDVPDPYISSDFWNPVTGEFEVEAMP